MNRIRHCAMLGILLSLTIAAKAEVTNLECQVKFKRTKWGPPTLQKVSDEVAEVEVSRASPNDLKISINGLDFRTSLSVSPETQTSSIITIDESTADRWKIRQTVDLNQKSVHLLSISRNTGRLDYEAQVSFDGGRYMSDEAIGQCVKKDISKKMF